MIGADPVLVEPSRELPDPETPLTGPSVPRSERTDMSDDSAVDPGRDAFFAALGRVFAEHRASSENYAICNLERMATVVGGGFDAPVGIGRDDDGNIVSTFSADFPDPIADELGDECFAVVPNFTTDPPSWDCVMYLTS
jgi:hypothetical protein